MRLQFRFHVYIMSSKSRVIYTGMTGNLVERVLQHKKGEIEGFTRRYKITRLVYYEPLRYSNNCINREKQVKAWTRAKRVALIEAMNPTWEDFAADWFGGNGGLDAKSRSLAALGMTNWMNDESCTTHAVSFQSKPEARGAPAPFQRMKAVGEKR